MFAREGASYFHNFLLAPLGGSVKCEEQFDSTDITGFSDQVDYSIMCHNFVQIAFKNKKTIQLLQTKDAVEGAACRLTALPTVTGNQSRTILIAPLLLVDFV